KFSGSCFTYNQKEAGPGSRASNSVRRFDKQIDSLRMRVPAEQQVYRLVSCYAKRRANAFPHFLVGAETVDLDSVVHHDELLALKAARSRVIEHSLTDRDQPIHEGASDNPHLDEV